MFDMTSLPCIHLLTYLSEGDVSSIATTSDPSTSTSDDNSTDTSFADGDVGRPGNTSVIG